MAGKARLITVESRNATIDTITATTIARLVGAASRNVTAGAVRRVTIDWARKPIAAHHRSKCTTSSSGIRLARRKVVPV